MRTALLIAVAVIAVATLEGWLSLWMAIVLLLVCIVLARWAH